MCKSFPVIRNGRLAVANNLNTKEQVIANYDESNSVLNMFFSESTSINDTLDTALKEQISQLEFVCPEDTKFNDLIKLQSASRSKSFTPVFDFADRLIRVNQFLIVIRSCVTVCTAEDVLGFEPSNKDNIRSKFWNRAMCIAVDDKLAEDVQQVNLDEFVLVANEIARITNSQLIAPYEKLFSQAVGKNVDISLNEDFSFFAVGSDDENFKSLFSNLRGGKSFREFEKHMVAQKLVELACIQNIITVPEGEPLPVTLQKIAEDDDTQLFSFEDTWHYRGIFLGQRNETTANFAGIAQFPDGVDFTHSENNPNTVALRHQPSIRVSAQAINEFAMRL